MPGGQRSQSGRPGGSWSISGVHLLCSATRAGGAWDTPPLALTNPSCRCCPHLPAGVCLDPGIWGKGHLGQEGDWGRGEAANQLRHLLLLFWSSCPPSGPGVKGWWPWPHLWSSQSCGSSEPRAQGQPPGEAPETS